MEIKLDLPDWVNEHTVLRVVAGTELVAIYFDGVWRVKTSRCSRCGDCCRTAGPEFAFYDPDKGCKFLEEESDGIYRCANPDQPWDCVKGGVASVEGCSIAFEEV